MLNINVRRKEVHDTEERGGWLANPRVSMSTSGYIHMFFLLSTQVNKAMKEEPFCEVEFKDLLQWMDTQNYIFYSSDMVYPI